MNSIVCENVQLNLKNKVILNDLSFSIKENSMTGLLGAQGAGKTSVIRLLSGRFPIEGGKIEVAGYSPISSPEEIHKVTGVTTGSAKLYENMTAMDNMAFFGKISGLRGTESMERASYLMHLLDIWESKDQIVAKLDTNSKRKLSIARALMSKPSVLLLDEPTKGFDMQATECTNLAIRTIAEDEKITVLMTAEEPEDLNTCDSFIILDAGNKVAFGSLEELQKQSGLKNKAVIKVLNGDLALPGLEMERISDTVYQKEIDDPKNISELIKKAVFWGAEIAEAIVIRPTLTDIYEKLVVRPEVSGEEGSF